MNRALLVLAVVPTLLAAAPRQREKLDRGVVALRKDDGSAFVSWRLTSDDPQDIAFVVDRIEEGKPPRRLTPTPLTTASSFHDPGPVPAGKVQYGVSAVLEGKEGVASLSALEDQPYVTIPLQTLPGHTPNDASVGDLDGDGAYEIVLKQEMRPRDNSQAGRTGESKLEAYTIGGKFLWRINLGKNIREGCALHAVPRVRLRRRRPRGGRVPHRRWHGRRYRQNPRRPARRSSQRRWVRFARAGVRHDL